jgi:hypothetical protein
MKEPLNRRRHDEFKAASKKDGFYECPLRADFFLKDLF